MQPVKGTYGKVGGTIIRAVNPKTLSPRTVALCEGMGRNWISRNSKCPCGSGKRFKRCCMKAEKKG